MFFILFIAVVFLPSSTAYVDCRIACRHCRENREHAILLEVHCAMCEECKLRRKEMLHGPRLPTPVNNSIAIIPRILTTRQRTTRTEPTSTTTVRYEVEEENYPEDCPKPPTCESDEESAHIKLKHPISTTTTTKRPPCPSVVTCKNKRTTTSKATPVPCTPCMPLCVNPCPYQSPLMTVAITPPPAPSTVFAPGPVFAKMTAPTSSDYYYVYVGMPKSMVKNGGI